MVDDRTKKIEALFHEAQERTPGERAAFLDAACGGDDALRAEVASLLGAIDDEPDFLDRPAWSAFVAGESRAGDAEAGDNEAGDEEAAGAEESLPFERLGEFRLIRRLGSGGMGVVYLAEQDSLGRKAAVKVIRPEQMGGFEMEMRFCREVEAISELRDPHIVTIYGSGEEQGVRWFAMEYVPGRGLDEVLHDPAGGEPPPVSRLVGWTRDIARALQSAHDAGIIHRDVKPSNIRITPEGKAMLFDFGVARHASLSTLTLTGDFRGTPFYASPEQVRARKTRIDHRTDVYSLGATLYEAVTGRVLFEGETTEQVFLQILEADPEPPCKVNRAISRDLGTVIETAIDKNPERRYPTAAAFADDLERVLEGAMIAARPAGLSTRFLRRVRRHPVLSTAAAVAVVALTALFLYVLWSYPQILEERDRAEEQTKAALKAQGEAERQKTVALKAQAEAEREADKSRAINEFLIGMLSSPDPDEDGRDVKVADVLGKAADTIAGTFAGMPGTEAACRHTIAVTYGALGLLEQAEMQHIAALELLTVHLGEDHADTLVAKNGLANVYRKQGRIDEAEALYGEVLAAYRAIHGDEHPNTLSIRNNLGLVLFARGDFTGAEEMHEEVAEGRARRLGADHPDTLKSRNNHANALWRMGELDAAEELLRSIVAAKRRVLGDGHSSTLASLFNLAVVVKNRGKLDEAETLQREVLEIQAPLLGEEHPDTLASVYNLASTLFSLGRLDESEELHRKAFEGRKSALGRSHRDTRASMSYLAIVMMNRGNLPGAETTQRELVAICTSALGEAAGETMQATINLACILWEQGKVAETEPVFRKLVALSEAAGPRHLLRTAGYRVNHGECLVRLNRRDEARPILERAIEELERAGAGESGEARNARLLLTGETERR